MGMTTWPFCRCQRMMIWAGVLTCFFAIDRMVSSRSAEGLEGSFGSRLESGLYETSAIFLLSRKALSLSCGKYGCASTWLQTGLILAMARMSSTSCSLKLESLRKATTKGGLSIDHSTLKRVSPHSSIPNQNGPDRLDEALLHQLLHLPPRVPVVRLQVVHVLSVRVLGPERRVVHLLEVGRPVDQQLLDLCHVELPQDALRGSAHVLLAMIVVPDLGCVVRCMMDSVD